jgi:hypothetical protein
LVITSNPAKDAKTNTNKADINASGIDSKTPLMVDLEGLGVI